MAPLWAMQNCAPAAEAGVAPARTNAANPKPANAESFKRGVCELIDARSDSVKLVVLEASNIAEIDYTAAQALIETVDHCRKAGAVFAIARLESLRAQAALARFGIADIVGPHRIFHSVDDAIKALSSDKKLVGQQDKAP